MICEEIFTAGKETWGITFWATLAVSDMINANDKHR
jgi:hypothetical protein